MENENTNTKKGNGLRTKLMIAVGLCAVVLSGIFASYAFFQAAGAGNKNEEINVGTGSVNLTFADGNAGFNKALDIGGSETKTFTITNSGTVDAVVKMNFKNLISSYQAGTLTYTLKYSDTEDGTYADVVKGKNVPTSDVLTNKTLVNGLNIPAGKTYYYQLVITLNYTDFDQTEDLKASLKTEFSIEETATYTVTFIDEANPTEERDVTFNSAYGALPAPTREGYTFDGWYTEETGGEKIESTTTVTVKNNHNLYAHWTAVTEP